MQAFLEILILCKLGTHSLRGVIPGALRNNIVQSPRITRILFRFDPFMIRIDPLLSLPVINRDEQF